VTLPKPATGAAAQWTPGGFGHMGLMSCQIEVSRVVAIRRIQ
jgi:hypothetical protein